MQTSKGLAASNNGACRHEALHVEWRGFMTAVYPGVGFGGAELPIQQTMLMDSKFPDCNNDLLR
jgi:hypothetical protein